jgi:8-oxo-dGTP pyrophosphatase MutT (NUDIX family)
VKWTVRGERSLYESDWVALRLVDVELPNGERFEHHVVRVPREAAAVVLFEPGRGILLLWRHRFITDSWGWEIPGGAIDAGEKAEEAAAREALEETGWRPGPLTRIGSYHPMPGLADQTFHVFLADGATHEREPDGVETDRVAWFPVRRVRELIADGEVNEGFSLTALLWFLALDSGP